MTRPSTRQRGAQAEAQARAYLERAGLQFIAANVHCRGGELDLVMRDGTTLVFVEVRQRNRSDYGSAAESITLGKRQRLIRAARFYLHRHGTHDQNCRFDVAALNAGGHIEWLRDAFRADD